MADKALKTHEGEQAAPLGRGTGRRAPLLSGGTSGHADPTPAHAEHPPPLGGVFASLGAGAKGILWLPKPTPAAQKQELPP